MSRPEAVERERERGGRHPSRLSLYSGSAARAQYNSVTEKREKRRKKKEGAKKWRTSFLYIRVCRYRLVIKGRRRKKRGKKREKRRFIIDYQLLSSVSFSDLIPSYSSRKKEKLKKIKRIRNRNQEQRERKRERR